MSDSEHNPPKDVVLVYSHTDDGEGARVLRSRDGRVEAGEVRALREGMSIQGVEVVKLEPRPESPLLFDVDVQYDARTSPHSGPPRVTSRAFRDHFDAIFGTREGGEEGGAVN